MRDDPQRAMLVPQQLMANVIQLLRDPQQFSPGIVHDVLTQIGQCESVQIMQTPAAGEAMPPEVPPPPIDPHKPTP